MSRVPSFVRIRTLCFLSPHAEQGAPVCEHGIDSIQILLFPNIAFLSSFFLVVFVSGGGSATVAIMVGCTGVGVTGGSVGTGGFVGPGGSSVGFGFGGGLKFPSHELQRRVSLPQLHLSTFVLQSLHPAGHPPVLIPTDSQLGILHTGQHSFPFLYEHPPPPHKGPQLHPKLHLSAQPAPLIVAETGRTENKMNAAHIIIIIFFIVQ
jgi:hypothetical protein